MGSHDWNRTAVQRLILDAEDTLKALDDALTQSNTDELAHAVRNGRQAYKELVTRRRSYLLTPLSATALEHLLSKIKGRLYVLREKIAYQIRRP